VAKTGAKLDSAKIVSHSQRLKKWDSEKGFMITSLYLLPDAVQNKIVRQWQWLAM
jgi:hypothetical protein